MKEGKSYAASIRNIESHKNIVDSSTRVKKNKRNLKWMISRRGMISLIVSEKEVYWENKGYVWCVRNVYDIQSLQ